jgi:hypothetical protein
MGDTCGLSMEAVVSSGFVVLSVKLMRGGCKSGGAIGLPTGGLPRGTTGGPGTSCGVPGGSVGCRRVS